MTGEPPSDTDRGGHPAARVRTLVGVTLALSLVPAAANGFGRFAYGLVLPPMQSALGWTSLTAGSLGAANAAGYLAGALLTGRVLGRLGEARAILASSALSAVSVLACALTGNVPVLALLRLVAGAAAAVAFIGGGSVVARLATGADPRRAGRLLGLYFSGPGLGIAVSALVIPPIAGPASWRWCWVVLGGCCLVCTLAAAPALARAEAAPAVPSGERVTRWEARQVAPLLVSYTLFGAGYIAYMTFVVAYLKGAGQGPGELAVMWLCLGLAGVVVSVTLFPRLQHLRDGRGVALILAIVGLASAIPLLSTARPVAILSAVGFSGMLSLTAAVTAVARHHLPPDQWAAAIAGLTVAFGVGQSVGPLLSGALADSKTGVRLGLLVGSLLLLAGAGVALLQRGPAGARPASCTGSPAPDNRGAVRRVRPGGQ